MTGADPRVSAARSLFERTGSRQTTVDGLVSRGYSAAEAAAAVEQVTPARPTPAAGATSPGSPGTAAAGTPDPTTPRPARGARGGAGLFSGRRRPSPALRPSLTLPRRPDAGDVAGFGFGLLLFVLARNYLQHGTPGVKGWLSAKFLNRPMPVDALDEQLDEQLDDDDEQPAPRLPRPGEV